MTAVMDFTHPEYLVSTDWLAANFYAPDIRVLDVTAELTKGLENRAAIGSFRDAHIPGSVPFDVASGKGPLSDPTAGLPWMWPRRHQISRALAAAGVGPSSRVIIVARTPREGVDSGTIWCTRAWWILHHAGIDCAILRGGVERWRAEGRPLVAGDPTPATAEPIAPPDGSRTGRASTEDVVAAVDAGPEQISIVDALSERIFSGDGSSFGPRPGHIEGAINLPFDSLIAAETADFVGAAEMHRRLTEAGVLDERPVITYCGGGVAATVDAFALALFGKTDVAVYDAGLMEWSADASLPMSTERPRVPTTSSERS